MTTTDKTPTTKVAAGGAVGLITALIMWAISASGITVPDAVLAGIPWLAGVLAAYLTPDRLVELGREVRDGGHRDTVGRHADNGNDVPNDAGQGDHLEVIPVDVPATDTKSDAAGYETP